MNLITTRIDRVTRTGVRTVDGLEHQADAVIFATGFDLEVMINLAQTAMLMIKSEIKIMIIRRQVQSLIPKKGWKGNWLKIMVMRPQLTSVILSSSLP